MRIFFESNQNNLEQHLTRLSRKRRTTIHFERHLLTELHVFQNLRESHNMKNRTIKINISIQIYNQKCNLLYHGFPAKSTA